MQAFESVILAIVANEPVRAIEIYISKTGLSLKEATQVIEEQVAKHKARNTRRKKGKRHYDDNVLD